MTAGNDQSIDSTFACRNINIAVGCYLEIQPAAQPARHTHIAKLGQVGTGELDAFEWKAPAELLSAHDPLVIEEADAALDQASAPAVDGAAPALPGDAGTIASPAMAEAVAAPPGSDGPADDLETEIFVPPHAPDDPGPEMADTDSEAQGERKFPAPSG